MHTDSKTAEMAALYVKAEPGTRLVDRFEHLRGILRNEAMRQSGVGVAPVEQNDPMRASIFFLDGEAHKQRRAAIIRFFTPKAIATRHLPVMAAAADRLIADFTAKGQARLDVMSLRLAAAVVAEIVGLTESNIDAMAHRIERSNGTPLAWRGGLGKLIAPLKSRFYGLLFFYRDVRPAIAVRRARRREDVISRLLDEGRSDMEVLVECATFGMAGMTTTREFIVAAAWHLFDNSELRERFLAGDEADQNAILSEILRLEPVAGMIYRTADESDGKSAGEPIAAGTRLSLHIRSANLDAAAVGSEPGKLDPGRAARLRNNGAWMSFGDGVHFCPGWQVAITETRVLLDKLLRVPGVRLVRPPDMAWVPPMLQSYELRNAVIACDTA